MLIRLQRTRHWIRSTSKIDETCRSYWVCYFISWWLPKMHLCMVLIKSRSLIFESSPLDTAALWNCRLHTIHFFVTNIHSVWTKHRFLKASQWAVCLTIGVGWSSNNENCPRSPAWVRCYVQIWGHRDLWKKGNSLCRLEVKGADNNVKPRHSASTVHRRPICLPPLLSYFYFFYFFHGFFGLCKYDIKF